MDVDHNSVHGKCNFFERFLERHHVLILEEIVLCMEVFFL